MQQNGLQSFDKQSYDNRAVLPLQDSFDKSTKTKNETNPFTIQKQITKAFGLFGKLK